MDDPQEFSTELDSDDLESFASPSDEDGLSLDDLSESFAQLLGQGKDPYSSNSTIDDSGREENAATDDESESDPSGADQEPLDDASEDACPVTPKSILEAMLFVGHPDNEPLTSRQVASLMRGVRAAEIHDLIEELNDDYRRRHAPYEIRSVGSGYRLELCEDCSFVRERFYGKVREAKLSQVAVDVLSVVAYNQPITRGEVDELCSKSVGGILSQLVRRELLRIERTDERPVRTTYHTTDRFLQFFGLASLDDLPRSHAMDRDL
ncbi:MAG: SMC-Scp complex subunit ScpB [Planctomycetales bacterium]|nr:SMC-Scp complex subunit ScpB [Planctomycetales bacterium]